MLVASEKDNMQKLLKLQKSNSIKEQSLPRDNYETVEPWPNKEPLFSGMNTIGQGSAT